MAPFVGGALVVVVITISCGGVGNSPLKNMIVGNSIITDEFYPGNALTCWLGHLTSYQPSVISYQLTAECYVIIC